MLYTSQKIGLASSESSFFRSFWYFLTKGSDASPGLVVN